MKTKLTATAAAAAIAMTGMTAAPASALTQQEAFTLFAGLAAIALLTNASATLTPAPTPTPIVPVTYSTGPILLKQTYTADFDHGLVSAPGADIWFQAVNPTHRYLKPLNGAKMAVGNRSNRGFSGCSAASFSGARVNINYVPVGSYVCMKTNAGRISQFRVNAVYGGSFKKMRLGYTTWQ
ncbi:MAG: hypothetical protein GXP05_12380 [Alphaproteobacteria bacterium]|nr:hypothetical protein [Alphaproteobacteria bacterium]